LSFPVFSCIMSIATSISECRSWHISLFYCKLKHTKAVGDYIMVCIINVDWQALSRMMQVCEKSASLLLATCVYCVLLQLLASLSHEAEVDRNKADGLKPENIGKNRNPDIIPGSLQFGLSLSSLLSSGAAAFTTRLDAILMYDLVHTAAQSWVQDCQCIRGFFTSVCYINSCHA